MEIRDITDFVEQQYQHVQSGQLDKLLVARERVFPVTNSTTAARLGISTYEQ